MQKIFLSNKSTRMPKVVTIPLSLEEKEQLIT